MGGAVPMSSVGAGYMVPKSKVVLVTVRPCLDRFHVCLQKPRTKWAEIVAEFAQEHHAHWFAEELRKVQPGELVP